MLSYLGKHQYFNAILDDGSVLLTWGTDSTEQPKSTLGFYYATETSSQGETIYVAEHPNRLGFHYAMVTSTSAFGSETDIMRMIGVPYWFLTLLASMLTLWVWRKTRPRPNPATAFPVEISRDKQRLAGGDGQMPNDK